MTIEKRDFVDFCKAQGDKAIDHGSTPLHGKVQPNSSVFERCAVGSYFLHLHGRRLTRDESPEFYWELEAAIGLDVANKLGNHEPTTYKQLVKDLI